ncbi:hypothetical protein Bbelb_108680 [Branchiostoma belcheri]|nr:hypothetical protein Bbelb_108680 [Branchiostoma belcheri]
MTSIARGCETPPLRRQNRQTKPIRKKKFHTEPPLPVSTAANYPADVLAVCRMTQNVETLSSGTPQDAVAESAACPAPWKTFWGMLRSSPVGKHVCSTLGRSDLAFTPSRLPARVGDSVIVSSDPAPQTGADQEPLAERKATRLKVRAVGTNDGYHGGRRKGPIHRPPAAIIIPAGPCNAWGDIFSEIKLVIRWIVTPDICGLTALLAASGLVGRSRVREAADSGTETAIQDSIYQSDAAASHTLLAGL